MCTVCRLFLNIYTCQCLVSIQIVCLMSVVHLLFESSISSASLCLWIESCYSLIKCFVQTWREYMSICVHGLKKRHILIPCIAGSLLSKYDWNKMTCCKCSYVIRVVFDVCCSIRCSTYSLIMHCNINHGTALFLFAMWDKFISHSINMISGIKFSF